MPGKCSTESYFVDDDILVIKLSGSLDNRTAKTFRDEIEKCKQENTSKVIVDCAKLGYISSFGIGLLVTLQTSLRKRGGEVKLSAIQGPVAEVLKVVRIAKLLNIYGDIEFARQSFYE